MRDGGFARGVILSCTRPLKAYRGPDGKIEFSSKAGYEDRKLELRCGQCHSCRLRRTRAWAIRAVHEAQMHEQNCFLTLTYDEENVPWDGSLRVKDWQDFAKRARKRLGRFRFFHCGEYGDQHQRPHYHACIFGQDFSFDRELWEKKSGRALYVSKTLQELWPMGFSTIGALEFDSAAYVARYCLKKVGTSDPDLYVERYGRQDDVTGVTWTVEPEYATMSRRPGLGSSWFDKYKEDVYSGDFVVVKGRQFPPPQLLRRSSKGGRPRPVRGNKKSTHNKGQEV